MGAVPTGATLGESGPKRESAKAPRTPLGTVHPNLPSQIGDVRLVGTLTFGALECVCP